MLNLKRIGACIIVIFLVIFGVSVSCKRVLLPAQIHEAYNAIDAFHEIPENTIEVIAFGSNHVWKGIDPNEMYTNYGIGAYNYGCNWQWLNTTELFIKDAFKIQSPKVILIETVHIAHVHKNEELDGEKLYTTHMPWSEDKIEYMKESLGNHPKRWLSYLFPFIYIHSNWNKLDEHSFKDYITKVELINNKGYWPQLGTTPVTPGKYDEYIQGKIGNDAIEILDEIVELCNEHDTKIIFYTTPYQITSEWKNNVIWSDAIREYAEENGCEFIDFIELQDKVGIDGNTDFIDPDHLNDSGAKKVANYLGKFISDNYDITDMRLLEKNIWENKQ